MRPKKISLALVALAAAAALAACTATSPDPVSAERAALDIDSHGVVLNPFAPHWQPTWDRPFPGAIQRDVSVFYDGGNPHFALELPDGRAMHRYRDAFGWHDQILGGNWRALAATRSRTGSEYWIAATDYANHVQLRYASNAIWAASWLDLGLTGGRRPAMQG